MVAHELLRELMRDSIHGCERTARASLANKRAKILLRKKVQNANWHIPKLAAFAKPSHFLQSRPLRVRAQFRSCLRSQSESPPQLRADGWWMRIRFLVRSDLLDCFILRVLLPLVLRM